MKSNLLQTTNRKSYPPYSLVTFPTTANLYSRRAVCMWHSVSRFTNETSNFIKSWNRKVIKSVELLWTVITERLHK